MKNGYNFRPFKGRSIDLDKPVEIYRCLNRRGKTYSIRQNNIVVGHTQRFIIEDCEFIIEKSGKKRCIETKERNVHAYVKGTWSEDLDISYKQSGEVLYNPFDDLGFILVTQDSGTYSKLTKARTFFQLENKAKIVLW